MQTIAVFAFGLGYHKGRLRSLTLQFFVGEDRTKPMIASGPVKLLMEEGNVISVEPSKLKFTSVESAQHPDAIKYSKTLRLGASNSPFVITLDFNLGTAKLPDGKVYEGNSYVNSNPMILESLIKGVHIRGTAEVAVKIYN